jgi:hypothetical protein
MQHNEKAVAEATTKSSGSSDDVTVEYGPTLTKQTYVRKLDWAIIPILGTTYTILFIDRTNSGFPI